MSQFDQLTHSFEEMWSWIQQAPQSWRHPIRTPTCITVGSDGPRGRTMVLRDVHDHHLIFFTDRRSPKVTAIELDPRGALHGYDQKRKLQIQLSGEFLVIESHPRAKEWISRGLQRFEDYGSPNCPGQPLPLEVEMATMELAKEQFVILGFAPRQIEFLQLSSQGHRRALWTCQQSVWTVCHLIP